MLGKQRFVFFCWICLVVICFFKSDCLCAKWYKVVDDDERLALTQKLVEHFHDLDAALGLLAHKVEGHVIACSDTTEYLERVDFLRNTLSQVVFCVERPADKKSLQFLCALSTAMLECIEWLSRGLDTAGSDLNLEKIKVNNLPDDLHALEQLVDANGQRCRSLTRSIQTLNASFATRLFRRVKTVLGVVANYTIKSKIVMGVSATALGLYVFAKIKAHKDADCGQDSYAMSNRNKYGKREITADNLYTHVSKGNKYLRYKVRTWFEQNKDEWHAFVEQPGTVAECRKKRALIEGVLDDKGITSLSDNNIIYALPNAPEWLLKISGPGNRACLQVAHQDKEYGVDQSKVVPTYQTASRSFGALKYQEAIKKYKLNELEAVDSWLWSTAKSCDDTHCVVLERKIEHLKLLRDYSAQELGTLLTEKKIGQLLLAAKHVGLWNLTNKNIGVNTATGKLVLIDLEQPNTMKPSQMFNKDKSRYGHNINSGVQSFYQSLPVGSKLRDYVEKWARRDLEMMGADNAKDLISLFDANKKAVQDAKDIAQDKETGLKETQKKT